jgi:protein gp37
MGENTEISWTDHTFNPWWGCERISPACALCYADREATRRGFPGQFVRQAPHREFGDAHWKEPLRWAKRAAKAGGRRRVFCASMADVFEDHPTAERLRPRLFSLIDETPELDWLLLTKRPENAAAMLPEQWMRSGLPSHVWFGFSAEDQRYFERRYIAAATLPVRGPLFCSYEPALGPLDLESVGVLLRGMPGCVNPLTGEWWPAVGNADEEERGRVPGAFIPLRWCIAGGESGLPSQPVRPSHPDWFSSARDQCIGAGVAFHFKQWGEWVPYEQAGFGGWTFTAERDGVRYGSLTAEDHVKPALGAREVETRYPWQVGEDVGPCMVRVGKKIAGRLLDGRTWDELPEAPRV